VRAIVPDVKCDVQEVYRVDIAYAGLLGLALVPQRQARTRALAYHQSLEEFKLDISNWIGAPG
jgi:hypothetical protein